MWGRGEEDGGVAELSIGVSVSAIAVDVCSEQSCRTGERGEVCACASVTGGGLAAAGVRGVEVERVVVVSFPMSAVTGGSGLTGGRGEGVESRLAAVSAVSVGVCVAASLRGVRGKVLPAAIAVVGSDSEQAGRAEARVKGGRVAVFSGGGWVVGRRVAASGRRVSDCLEGEGSWRGDVLSKLRPLWRIEVLVSLPLGSDCSRRPHGDDTSLVMSHMTTLPPLGRVVGGTGSTDSLVGMDEVCSGCLQIA